MEEIIKEGNKLIAEFMGYEYYPESKMNQIKGVLKKDGFMPMHLDISRRFHAKYHSSWDWLMPVVEKIESIGFYTNILSADNDPLKHTMHITQVGEEEQYTLWANSKIEAVWKAVVEFIKCISITCDNCGVLFEESENGKSVFSNESKALDCAKEDGWYLYGKIHHCPGCHLINGLMNNSYKHKRFALKPKK